MGSFEKRYFRDNSEDDRSNDLLNLSINDEFFESSTICLSDIYDDLSIILVNIEEFLREVKTKLPKNQREHFLLEEMLRGESYTKKLNDKKILLPINIICETLESSLLKPRFSIFKKTRLKKLQNTNTTKTDFPITSMSLYNMTKDPNPHFVLCYFTGKDYNQKGLHRGKSLSEKLKIDFGIIAYNNFIKCPPRATEKEYSECLKLFTKIQRFINGDGLEYRNNPEHFYDNESKKNLKPKLISRVYITLKSLKLKNRIRQLTNISEELINMFGTKNAIEHFKSIIELLKNENPSNQKEIENYNKGLFSITKKFTNKLLSENEFATARTILNLATKEANSCCENYGAFLVHLTISAFIEGNYSKAEEFMNSFLNRYIHK